ncbi:hypothetical protein QI30_11455 [Kurthia sp. 3B1D]|uniref:GP-PDE domain-containing protein n=1 Tax=Candidatus Kurthia intestinigallinarum TaxID=1562256 RepID=A0A433RTP2_9BACL|nr:glycerophosphodiester phosphodiesterase family protein [Kurthia sp. 3B1D]RUS55537.1 hypothetical protein QI30_11455 [Kurthia sp. 3B1D]
MTKIFAHRGFRAMYPENTLLSFQKAFELGVDGIELDVHMTRDGELVAIHDESLKRTTGVDGEVIDYTYAELKKFRAAAAFREHKNYDGTWEAERIPTLRQVLTLHQKYPQVIVNIELKTNVYAYDGIEQKVLALVDELKTPHVIYSSFHLPTILRIRDIAPAAKIAWLIEDDIALLSDYKRHFQLDALHISKKLVLKYQEQWQDLLPTLRVWTVNDAAQIEEFLALGVDTIMTDAPDVALALRQ